MILGLHSHDHFDELIFAFALHCSTQHQLDLHARFSVRWEQQMSSITKRLTQSISPFFAIALASIWPTSEEQSRFSTLL